YELLLGQNLTEKHEHHEETYYDYGTTPGQRLEPLNQEWQLGKFAYDKRRAFVRTFSGTMTGIYSTIR
ncbi:MAG: hypothetical protein ACFFB7_07655, partial [Candidatus Sifarchaeia archaeon]